MSYIWQVSKAKGGFKLRVIAKNGKCVATFGETYKNKAHAMRMANQLSKQSIMLSIRNTIEQALATDDKEYKIQLLRIATGVIDANLYKLKFVG